MSFEIGNNGVASVHFNISLDSNSTIVKMMQPCQDNREFYDERDQIGRIFRANIFSFNSVEVDHGRYSEKTITKLIRVVNTLKKRSFIDVQRHDEIIQKVEEMVAQVKRESEQETKQFASLLLDFKTNVKSLYNRFNRSTDLMVDNSITRLDDLISEVYHYRGNPMKVGSRWLYLFLSEGALENLIKSLNTEEHNELKEKIEALHCGVTSFLQKYESELHLVIEKTIIENTSSFQQLYKDYISMVRTGTSPSEDCYGPIKRSVSFGTLYEDYYGPITTSMNLGTFQLYLPTRFDKSFLQQRKKRLKT